MPLWKRLPEEFRSKAGAKQLTLEEVLSLGKESMFRVYISGYDEFSGARRLIESRFFTKDDIRVGVFNGLEYGEPKTPPKSEAVGDAASPAV